MLKTCDQNGDQNPQLFICFSYNFNFNVPIPRFTLLNHLLIGLSPLSVHSLSLFIVVVAYGYEMTDYICVACAIFCSTRTLGWRSIAIHPHHQFNVIYGPLFPPWKYIQIPLENWDIKTSTFFVSLRFD